MSSTKRCTLFGAGRSCCAGAPACGRAGPGPRASTLRAMSMQTAAWNSEATALRARKESTR